MSFEKLSRVFTVVEPFTEILEEDEFKIFVGMLTDRYCTVKGIDNEKCLAEIVDAQKFVNGVCGKEFNL